MRKKIVLIDGHSILNRAFYGVPDLTTPEGLHTNAVYGFLNIMFKILDEEKPEYLTVTFDVHAPTFRHEMFSEYKGTRKPMAEELRQQVPVIKEVLEAMNISTIEKAGLEADDLLGTLSRMCEESGMDVSIISGDRDTLQLATEHVKIRIPKTKQGKTEIENYYAADVVERYKVTPREFIDVKALMGDSADNIPGVPGIGEKTATKIIMEYQTIENAYAHASELKPPRASKNIQEFWEQAKMSKVLATIETHADFEFDIEKAHYENPYTEEAYKIFERLRFKNMLGRFSIETKENKIEKIFREVTEKEEIERIFAMAEKAQCVGVALSKDEGNVLPLFAHPSGFGRIAIAWSEKDVVTIPCDLSTDMEFLFAKLSHVAEKVSCFSVCGLKEILPYIKNVKQSSAFDVIVAAYLLNPLKSDYTYEDVAEQYLGIAGGIQAELNVKCCYEAYTAFAAASVLDNKLKEAEMDRLFYEIEMPLVFTLYEMESAGVKVEAEALKLYGDQLGEQIIQLEHQIYEMAGEEFNINSPKQLGVILFEKLNMPHAKKTKTGYSTAADVLEKLAEEYPIVSKILEYRQLAKLKSTYADGLAVFIGDDGRIHGKFNQTVTATGRLSSTEPNLQNIPVRMELGRMIRKVFVPKEDCVFVDADYSQIELRIMAHLSEDKNMIDAFLSNHDIHAATAAKIYKIDLKDVDSDMRRKAKTANFGIIYGISVFGLAERMNVDRKEAKELIDGYFETYPSVKAYMDKSIQVAQEKGYVETIFHRKRFLPDINSRNAVVRGYAERNAINAPIQGSAADIIKVAMARIYQRFQTEGIQAKMILQVHDELNFSVPVNEKERVEEIVLEEMEHAYRMHVPLKADCGWGKNWLEAH